MKHYKRQITTFAGILFIFIFWIILSNIIKEEIVLPTVSTTFKTLIDLLKNKNTYFVLLNTIGGLILVVIISFFISLILSLISYKFPGFKNFVQPLLSLFKILPVPAVIIFFLVQFSQTITPYLLTTMIVIPIIYEGLYSSFISIDDDITDEVRTISSTNLKVIFYIYLPLTRVGIITSLLQSIGIGLKVKVMTEFVSNAPNTIGYQLNFAKSWLLMDQVFAWTIILVVVVILLDFVLGKFIKKIQ
ncbi:MAG: ABC transporter permease [Acholeplasmataceae bacterium]|jgi:NitT/TauT family transport system permease protein